MWGGRGGQIKQIFKLFSKLEKVGPGPWASACSVAGRGGALSYQYQQEGEGENVSSNFVKNQFCFYFPNSQHVLFTHILPN